VPAPSPRKPLVQPPQRLLSAAPTVTPLPSPRNKPTVPVPPRRPPPPATGPGVACAAQCEVRGDHVKQGLLQQPSRFVVLVRDALGEPVRHGGDTVRVSSRGPGPLRPSVTDEGDGAYTVGYLATVSGTYQLTITCNSFPIAGSPLLVTVEPSAAHAPACIADGAGLQRAVAGDATSFFIRAHDVLGRPKVMGGDAFDAFVAPLDEDERAPPSPSARGAPNSPAARGALASPAARGAPASRAPASPSGALSAGVSGVSLGSPRSVSASSPGARGRPAVSPLAVEVVDLGNGSYEGRYILKRAGRYALHVHRAGVPISGSPFPLRVRPAPTHANACALLGDGLVVAEAGKQSAFTIAPNDRYGNRRPVPTYVDGDGLLLRSPSVAAAIAGSGGDGSGLASDDALDRFEAVLVPKRGEHTDAQPVACTVRAAVRGDTYEVAYVASGAGEYEVRVSLHGVPLRERPILTVVSARASGPACTASGEGLVSANAGELARLTIQARDVYGNARDGDAEHFHVALRPARVLRHPTTYDDDGGGGDGNEDGSWIYEYATDVSELGSTERARSLEPLLATVTAAGDGRCGAPPAHSMRAHAAI
jgi:hypothetical protein